MPAMRLICCCHCCCSCCCCQGSVEATVDEEDAAVKWANVKEDPEYVI
jgi:hypothetical protein